MYRKTTVLRVLYSVGIISAIDIDLAPRSPEQIFASQMASHKESAQQSAGGGGGGRKWKGKKRERDIARSEEVISSLNIKPWVVR